MPFQLVMVVFVVSGQRAQIEKKKRKEKEQKKGAHSRIDEPPLGAQVIYDALYTSYTHRFLVLALVLALCAGFRVCEGPVLP